MSHVFCRLSIQLAGSVPKAAVRRVPTAPARIGTSWVVFAPAPRRTFGTSLHRGSNSYDDKAKALNQKGLDEQEQEVRVREHQVKRPWHRDGADNPPVMEDGKEKTPPTKGTLRRIRVASGPEY